RRGVVLLGPDLRGRHADRADRRRAVTVADEALCRRDVDGDRQPGAVALDDNHGRPAAGADRGGHVIEVVDVLVADLDDYIAGPDSGLRGGARCGPVTLGLGRLRGLRCDASGLTDDGPGVRM